MEKNNSGRKCSLSELPYSAKKVSWGAFWLSWIWGLCNETYIALLAIALPVIMNFVLLFKGRQWAWEHKRWDSEEQFDRVQKNWGIWGFIVAILAPFVFLLIGVGTTVGTFNIINRGRKSSDLAIVSPQYQAKAEPLQYDDSIESIRGVTADEVPGIFSIQVSLGYEEGNNRIAFELNARRREIQNIVFLHISNKSKDGLKPEYYTKLQEELKEQINRVMKSGKIKQVVFREFVVAQ